MKTLVLKLFVVIALACVPLPGYCAGDRQGQVPNNEDITRQDNSLIAAAGRGRSRVFYRLLNCSEIDDQARGDALIAAAGNGHIDLVELLFSDGRIRPGAIGKAFILAAGNGHLKVFNLLLAHGGNEVEEAMGGAFILAAGNGRLQIVNLLLARGGNGVEEAMGRALILAASNGRLEVVNMLVQAGANVNITDPEGRTVLTVAALNNNVQVARLLLRAGADLDTARDWAERNNRPEVINFLERALGRAQLEELGVANVRNATADDVVPTPMPRPTIGCDLHARGNMFYGVHESYF